MYIDQLDLSGNSLDVGLHQLARASRRQEMRFDVIANNIANVESPGFKADSLSFNEQLDEIIRTEYSPGHMRETQNTLDIALEGGTFFTIQTQNGIRYTRNGSFLLNSQGELVTQLGDKVMGRNGTIIIEGTDIIVDEDGEIWEDGKNTDTLALVNFGTAEEESGWFGSVDNSFDRLKKIGFSYFEYDGDPNTLPEAQNVKVHQGYLEQSNVNVANEMIQMVDNYRAFESYQKIIQTLIETDTKSSNEVGKLA